MRPVLIPAAFLCLAGAFLVAPGPRAVPMAPLAGIPSWAVDITPVRTPVLRPEILHSVYTYNCADCHSLLPSPPETERPLTVHRHIRLEHGINDRCFNCHHRKDRNVYVDDRGGPIPYDQPQLLCARCHGPVYRDWTHGVHGRTNGHWSARFGPMERKRCVECHDPHSPAFKPMKPAPGPRATGPGAREAREDHGDEPRNPLLIYRKRGEAKDVSTEERDPRPGH